MDELEEQNINVKKLSAEDEEKLNNLLIIEHYLSRGLDEHQKILNSHFDLSKSALMFISFGLKSATDCINANTG